MIQRYIFIFLLQGAFFVLPISALAQSIKVMTYNIRLDFPGDGINQWDLRKEKVYQLLKKYNPDVLGVQEALKHQLTDITENLNGYAYVGVGRDDGKDKGEFSSLFYRSDLFELVEQNTFWLSETPDVPGSKNWDAAITRVATWARLKDKETGKTIFVLNTHFDHIGLQARANSAAIIKQKATALAGDDPIIITGDFNCTRDEQPYKTMVDKSGVTLLDPAPSDPPGTFCNFGVNSMPCKSIDYIFHSTHWTSSNYVVISDNDGKNYPSDHLPVMVTLKMK